jgi:hypothetical protein
MVVFRSFTTLHFTTGNRILNTFTEAFTVSDTIDGNPPRKICISQEADCLFIQPEGTGTIDGDCAPIRLEFQNGKPVLYVWNNINSDEPVRIDLAAALESAALEPA